MKNRRQCHSLFPIVVRCLLLLFIVEYCETLNRNLPKLSPCAKWSTSGLTIFQQNNTQYYQAAYVDKNNLIYITEPLTNNVILWNDTSKTVVRNISVFSILITSITVTDNGDIYVSNSRNGSVNVVTRWTSNVTNGTVVMISPQLCYDLFIDRKDNIYCAAPFAHQVVKKSLNQSNLTASRVAGTGVAGFGADLLYYPCGIFVTADLLLYVADCGNARVQLFKPGETNGTTIFGNGVPGSLTVECPRALTMDADGYLYIVDSYQDRVFGSGPYGFRCVIGCPNTPNSAMYPLNYPQAAYFDTDGNMYVLDQSYSPLKKFLLRTNSCETFYNRPQLSPCATWNPNGTTVIQVNDSIWLLDIFVDKNNTLYTIDDMSGDLLIYPEGKREASRRLRYNGLHIKAIFVDNRRDIYFSTAASTVHMATWANNYSVLILIPINDTWCWHIFIDSNDTIYCSLYSNHQIIKRSLNTSTLGSVLVAGTGIVGSAPNQLHQPMGIFVETNLDLYVADTRNDRVQLFRLRELNGITVAGNGSINQTIALIRPVAVMLDADGFLFVSDYGNHRIIRSTPNGFTCIIGCKDGADSTSYPVIFPLSMAFDNAGNIFVPDLEGYRVLEFSLMSNSCEAISSTEVSSMNTMHSETSTLISSTRMIESTVLTSSIPLRTSRSSLVVTEQTSTPELITTITQQEYQPTQQRIISSTKVTLLSSTEIPSIDAFIAPECSDPTRIGLNCNASNNPCETLQPCQNDGRCIYNHSNSNSYICLCPSTHTGLDCEIDIRPCQSNTCLNNGTCFETSDATFNCSCAPGWKDVRCQTMINLCEDSLCQNDAVCRPSLLNYTCECLGRSYSGQYCEIIGTRLIVLKSVSKSFASVAMTAICSVVLFVVMMDILRYGFHLDPSRTVLEKVREEKNTRKMKKKRVRPVIVHFVYVDASASAERH